MEGYHRSAAVVIRLGQNNVKLQLCVLSRVVMRVIFAEQSVRWPSENNSLAVLQFFILQSSRHRSASWNVSIAGMHIEYRALYVYFDLFGTKLWRRGSDCGGVLTDRDVFGC